MNKYNVNLAAEFYVLSTLHRLGAEATLTLGNKKSVDIVVVRTAGNVATVDVKGLAGKYSWPVDNVSLKKNHFVVFVTFLGKIHDPTLLPEVYVVPSIALPELTYSAPGGRKNVPLGKLRKKGQQYLNCWQQLL